MTTTQRARITRPLLAIHWKTRGRRVSSSGDANFPAAYSANPDESTAYWIKLVANQDGSFRVLNQRTGVWQDYGPRNP